ncbi:hypothetical protein C0Q70_07520 [Pomacea canaliculata]|uniref:UDENN domain-containing protein n=1 Tax=Pomacea canaliculata TaxID=400727 RepID=A0A2T7PF97_POMCA|nr:hypothetical protein C0Q70_07520 [Pomacea canaliculata]
MEMIAETSEESVVMDGGEEICPGPMTKNGMTMANRLAELMLVVGINDDTGLIPLNGRGLEKSGEDLFSNIYFEEYEPHVLAAVSATKALYFQPYFMEDPDYPPTHQPSQQSSAGKQQDLSKRGQRPRAKFAPRGPSVSPAVITHHLKKVEPGKMSASMKGADLPISEDVIRSLTTFCFPDNVKVYRECPEDSVHFLVLTDIAGNKTFATCITFYKPYIIELGSKCNLVITLDLKESSSLNSREVRGFFPQCCCVVSKAPYFYATKEILSCLISHVEHDMEEMYTFVKDFTYTMTMCPVPPAGNVIVEMSVYNLSVMLYPAECAEKPVNDLPLHLVFLCFHADDVLRILSAVLMEQRIVFVSSNYALLTIIMESFLYYILPFRWRFTYVPILSATSLELLEAPGTFMMGCHTRHLDIVALVGGLVVVNVDEGTLSVNPETCLSPRRGSITNSNIIPDVPQESANLFKKICKRVRFQLELSDVQRPFYYDIEQERMFRMKKCLQFNAEISFAFLELMVNLFRGVMPCLRVEVRQFNKQSFLESIEFTDKPFYEKVVTTDMFKMFIEDRLNERVDQWSEYEMKTRPWAKRAGGLVDSTSISVRAKHLKKPLRKQVSISTFSSSLTPKVFEVFSLPPLNDSRSYIRNSICKLNKAFDLPEIDREDILRRKGLNHVQELTQGHEPRSPGFVETAQYLKMTSVCLEEFVETVSLLAMSNDYDTIQRLFHALCMPMRPTHVDHYTMEMLYHAYVENEKQCEQLVVPEDFLKSEELLLRVSALVKTDFGNGRIVLTDKRIFFLKDGTNAFREVVKVRNITSVEKQQVDSLLYSVKTLFIDGDNGKLGGFTAVLKEERNCWAMLVEEMRAGRLVAEATKDVTAVSQAIQNVLLVDAIIRSGQDENTTHHRNLTQVAESMCYFTTFVAEGHHKLSQDTMLALQQRVDPNIGQRERKTVEVLLYTPGCESLHVSQGNIPPRLWCGMGDGKVKVFDATNWTLEKTFVQTKSTVTCLAAVGDTQVWAGSQGIFIIDTATISCNKTLTDHLDLVSDIAISKSGRHAYSSCVGGVLIKWEVQTLTALYTFSLGADRAIRSLSLNEDNQLWCGTWESIHVVSADGKYLQSFEYPATGKSKQEQLDCLLVVKGEIWAGCRRSGQIVVWDKKTAKYKDTIQVECRGVSIMLCVGDKIWVGTKDGTIFIYKPENRELWKKIKAHDDAIRAMCTAEERYVISGSGSKDGKVAIWSPLAYSMELSNPSIHGE